MAMRKERRYKLGILTTHPVQYQVPWFQELAARSDVDLSVFFCMIPNERQQGEGFGIDFRWDIPLLDGYRHEVLKNRSPHPSVSRYDGCDTPGISRIVEQGGFDAFISHGWIVRSCLQLLKACRRFGVPCLVRGESNNIRRRPFWKRTAQRMLLRRYAAFLAIGKANREFYLENGVPPNRIFWTPYCVDNRRFARGAAEFAKSRGTLRREWKIDEEACTFIFCGKFISKKRPHDILRALRILCVEGRVPEQGIHFLAVGEGEGKESCRRYAVRHGLPVTFAGFMNQGRIPEAYAASDCLVLPSDDGETWGLVVNEAMACGLPAIVSDRVGCGRDLVIPGLSGEVFPVGNVRALADRMAGLAGEEGLAATMGEEARRVVGQFNYEEVARGTVAALRFAASYRAASRRIREPS
ncbi:MAG: glycosyltransferase family 4 protein [Lentisphaerae bacterium]|nr:glycosyltransferase family 4 protein [Lentisphaerota bacterium]